MIPATVSLFRGALAKKFRDVEVYKIGVMKNNRFDRALVLVPFVAVRGYDMQNFAANSVLVRERQPAERMTHLLSGFSLDDFAGTVLVVFEWFADIGQERTGDEIIPLDRNGTAERFF